MRCPYCNHPDSRVVDSRDAGDGSVRRRRECAQCGLRCTTYERIQTTALVVIKRDGRREEFNRDKLLRSLRLACAKRPLPLGTVDKIVDEIDTQVLGLGRAEVPSHIIGEMVMERLQRLDRVAYIRFASVYRDFQDLDTFKQEVETLLNSRQPKPGPGLEASPQLTLLPLEATSRRQSLRPGRPRRGTQPERRAAPDEA